MRARLLAFLVLVLAALPAGATTIEGVRDGTRVSYTIELEGDPQGRISGSTTLPAALPDALLPNAEYAARSQIFYTLRIPNDGESEVFGSGAISITLRIDRARGRLYLRGGGGAAGSTLTVQGARIGSATSFIGDAPLGSGPVIFVFTGPPPLPDTITLPPSTGPNLVFGDNLNEKEEEEPDTITITMPLIVGGAGGGADSGSAGGGDVPFPSSATNAAAQAAFAAGAVGTGVLAVKLMAQEHTKARAAADQQITAAKEAEVAAYEQQAIASATATAIIDHRPTDSLERAATSRLDQGALQDHMDEKRSELLSAGFVGPMMGDVGQMKISQAKLKLFTKQWCNPADQAGAMAVLCEADCNDTDPNACNAHVNFVQALGTLSVDFDKPGEREKMLALLSSATAPPELLPAKPLARMTEKELQEHFRRMLRASLSANTVSRELGRRAAMPECTGSPESCVAQRKVRVCGHMRKALVDEVGMTAEETGLLYGEQGCSAASSEAMGQHARMSPRVISSMAGDSLKGLDRGAVAVAASIAQKEQKINDSDARMNAMLAQMVAMQAERQAAALEGWLSGDVGLFGEAETAPDPVMACTDCPSSAGR